MTGVRGCSELDLRRRIGIYYAMTALVDDCVGRLLDALERTGQRENTIVVFTADHGDLVGEHGMAEKGGLLCDALVRVPLLLTWPGHLPAACPTPRACRWSGCSRAGMASRPLAGTPLRVRLS